MLGKDCLVNTPSSEQMALKVTLSRALTRRCSLAGVRRLKYQRKADFLHPARSVRVRKRQEQVLAAFLGPFMFHSECKPTVLKPDIFIAENLEAMGNKEKKEKENFFFYNDYTKNQDRDLNILTLCEYSSSPHSESAPKAKGVKNRSSGTIFNKTRM